MPARHAEESDLQQVVIDCDPGIDDAMTLALAAFSPEIALRAVTTVAGNVPLHQTTANALALLDAMGRPDVPVAAGAARGLVRIKPPHRDVHGANGLGGVRLAAPARSPSEGHAVDALAAALGDAETAGVTIVAVGPLTNIALLLALRPDVSDRIARIVIMGGSAGAGNVTPHAEYNIWADPEAAERVLGSGVEICLAQLQATRHVTLEAGDRRALESGSWLGAQLGRMMDGYDGGRGVNPALHDVVALAAVLDPDVVRTRPARVEVVTDLGARRGATVVDFDPAGDGQATVQVVVEVDVPRVRRLLVERVTGSA